MNMKKTCSIVALASCVAMTSPASHAGFFDDLVDGITDVVSTVMTGISTGLDWTDRTAVSVTNKVAGWAKTGIYYKDKGLSYAAEYANTGATLGEAYISALGKSYTKVLCDQTLCRFFDLYSDQSFATSSTVQALTLQNRIDGDAPLKRAVFPYTHNSYNAQDYSDGISYLLPNHEIGIYNQLLYGIRALELDVHWEYGKTILCHNGGETPLLCSANDRDFEEGLEEINTWLSVQENAENEVLLIYLEEHLNGQYTQAINALNAQFGSKIYKPSEKCSAFDHASKGILDITKNDLLAQGKNIILIGADSSSCQSNWGNYVFTGTPPSVQHDQISDYAGGCWDSHNNRGGDEFQNNIYRAWNDGTTDLDPKITDAQVATMAECGVAAISPEPLEHADSTFAEQVWSWESGAPDNYWNLEDCGAQQSNGRLQDSNCANESRFACQKLDTREWKITVAAGPWEKGADVCANEYGDLGYSFSVPVNGYENQELLAERSAISDQIWINYSDLSGEGNWQPFEKLPFTITSLGKCLTVNGGVAVDGANIEIYDCNGNASQEWAFDGLGRIQSIENPQLCLDNANKDVYLNACMDTDSRWHRKGDTLVHNSGDLLTVYANQSNNHQNVILVHEVANADNQVWNWDNVNDYGAVSEYHLLRDNRCLALQSGNYLTRAVDCNGTEYQRWTFDTHERIHYAADPEKCLDLDWLSTLNHTSVVVKDCNNTSSQKWYWDGTHLRNRYNNMALSGDSNFGDYHGAQKHFDINASDQWWVRSGAVMPNEEYNFINGGRCLTSYGGNSAVNGTNVILWDCVDGENQNWIPDASGRLHSAVDYDLCLESGSNGHARTLQLATCSTSDYQQWTQKGMLLMTKDNYVVNLAGGMGNHSNGANVIAYPLEGGIDTNETWVAVRR